MNTQEIEQPTKKINYDAILREAIEAANAAQVGGQDEGPCGFAWVTINNGRHPFVNWCKKRIKEAGAAFPNDERQRMLLEQRASRIYGSKHWQKGWEFWKPGNFNGQAIHVHEAGAKAFAWVLNKYGIQATYGSRWD